MEGFEQNLEHSAKAGKSNIIGLLELMDARTDYLLNHPLFKKEAPTIENVSAIRNEEKISATASIRGATNAYLCYRLEPFRLFKRIPMEHIEGDLWGINVEAGEIFEYYIIAEDERTVRLSPEKASFEFYTLSLKQ